MFSRNLKGKGAGYLSVTVKRKGRMPEIVIGNIRGIIICSGAVAVDCFLIKGNDTAAQIPRDLL